MDKLVAPQSVRSSNVSRRCGQRGPSTTTSRRRNAASSRSSATAEAAAARGARPARAAAPRPGGRRHRQLRRRSTSTAIARSGLIGDSFSRRSVIDGLPGHAAIGHTRYSTTGASMLRNVQPLFADFAFGGLAIAHNGNLTNAHALRQRLVERGLAVPVDQRHRGDHPPDRAQPAPEHRRPGRRRAARRSRAPGRWSACSTTASSACAIPLGVRPLVLGRARRRLRSWPRRPAPSTSWAPSFVRDVEPGEIVVIDARRRPQPAPVRRPEPRRFCIFEYVYFARPDSVVEGRGVYEVRKRIGAELARESGVPADVVVPVPDSGVPAAIGYAQESGLAFELGIIRNHYVGRTFIEPTDHIRHLGVKLKHNANRVTLAGKRVILVDDSIVRGTTSTKIVGHGARRRRHRGPYADRQPAHDPQLLLRGRHARAQQAHGGQPLASRRWRGSSASTASPSCPSTGSTAPSARPRRDGAPPQYCDACFTGDYPTRLADIEGELGSEQLSLHARGRAESADWRLAGRVILITGASRGLGAAVAVACAAEGAKLVLVARTARRARGGRRRASARQAARRRWSPSTSPRASWSTRSGARCSSATAGSTAWSACRGRARGRSRRRATSSPSVLERRHGGEPVWPTIA